METDLFATRVATRFRLPIAAVGIASLLLAVGNLLFEAVNNRLIIVAAAMVGIAAVGLFLCAVFDARFQRAVSALNAKRRRAARNKGRLSRLTGWGLPVGDPLLLGVSLPLLAACLVAANHFHRGPTTALLFGAFALVGLTQIALMVRGQSTDRWYDPLA